MAPKATATKSAAKTTAKGKAKATAENIRPGAKPGWWRSKKGKKSLQRAKEHRQLMEDQADSLDRLMVVPAWHEDAVFLHPRQSIFATIRSGNKVEAARLCMFLLQLLILLIRTWVPSIGLKQHLGTGRETCTRMAILWHHVHRLDAEHVKRLRSIGQDLFLRAVSEGDADPSAFQKVQDSGSSSSQMFPSKEWSSPDRLQVHFADVLVPQMLGGYYPGWREGMNFQFEYSGRVWQDPFMSAHVCHFILCDSVLFLVHVSSAKVSSLCQFIWKCVLDVAYWNASPHICMSGSEGIPAVSRFSRCVLVGDY